MTSGITKNTQNVICLHNGQHDRKLPLTCSI